jgi:S1-C subfamily serine protease
MLPLALAAVFAIAPWHGAGVSQAEPVCAGFPQIGDPEICRSLRMQLLPTTHPKAGAFGLRAQAPAGMMVVFPDRGSLLSQGDVITTIDNRPVASIADVARALGKARAEGRKTLSAMIYDSRQGVIRPFGVRIED